MRCAFRNIDRFWPLKAETGQNSKVKILGFAQTRLSLAALDPQL